MKIHHNTQRRANKLGLVFGYVNGEYVVLTKAGVRLSKAADPKDALDLAILDLTTKPTKSARKTVSKPRDDDEELDPTDDNIEEDEEDASRSVVKSKYKELYRPNKMTCGDTLAKQVRDRFMTQKDEDTGRPRLDFNAFVAFAKANECWVESYRSLKDRNGNRNNGMIRMNVINRLRAKVKAGHKVVWN